MDGQNTTTPAKPSNSRFDAEAFPRHNPIHAITMGAIAKDAGLPPSEFRDLL
jgi:hypothetical protein